MIRTVADLLEEIRINEKSVLDRYKIPHALTIGKMYEGLTQEILEMSIPADRDLYVRSGFIKNSSGELSRQIDCMLVCGEGESIPHTDDYFYDLSKVVAVLEIKKSLYSSELTSSYENLLSVRRLHENTLERDKLFEDAYRSILGRLPDRIKAVSERPLWERQIGWALYADAISPVRIVVGYSGFASELSFREAFLDLIERNTGVDGYGPSSLPDLLISGSYSLVKLNGMPYASPVTSTKEELFADFEPLDLSEGAPINENLWPMYASYAGNPTILLLELIWTRLAYQRLIPDSAFGEDLDFEVLKPLLLAKAVKRNDKVSWFYHCVYFSDESLRNTRLSTEWTPIEIDEGQAILLMFLASYENEDNYEGVSINDPELIDVHEKSGCSLKQSLASLVEARLISLVDGRIQLLTRECTTAFLPDGRIVAADNIAGRLTKWLRLQDIKSGKIQDDSHIISQ